MSQKFFQELVTSRKNYPGGDGIVGQVGRLWFENETNSIRLSDGVRPGGRIITNGVWYNNDTNSLMWTDPETDIEYVIASAGPRAANQLTNGSVSLVLNADGSVSFPNYTFPSNDGSANQVLVTNGSGILSWQNQTGSGGGNSHVTVSDTAPSTPASGDLWYNSNTGRTYIYYNNAWVDSNPQGDFRVKIGSTSPRRPVAGDLWYNTLVQQTYIYVDGDWVSTNTPGAVINRIIDIPDVYTGGAGDPMLQDGVTLIYSADQTRWETKPLDSVQINLDGGGY